jgi:hypothetical protein
MEPSWNHFRLLGASDKGGPRSLFRFLFVSDVLSTLLQREVCTNCIEPVIIVGGPRYVSSFVR